MGKDMIDTAWFSGAMETTTIEEYLFDLQGFVILRSALTNDHVRECNDIIDRFPRNLGFGDWWGNVHVHTFNQANNGINLQQIYEAGEPFERLVDHPTYIKKVQRFVGGDGSFDYNHGPLFIDENFASLRGPGEAIGLHSGGYAHTKRGQFAYFDGKFACGQINVLTALTDIGPGDGATMVIPGSHKSNFEHPAYADYAMESGAKRSVDGVAGAIEVHLEAGDSVLFVDSLSHGSAARTNPGERRILVYRYGPSWGYFRFGYQPSDELMDRLTPDRRVVVNPHHERLLPQGRRPRD